MEQACWTVGAVCATLTDPWPSSGLSLVIGPSYTDNSHQEFSTKGELELACIDEAGHHFTWANGTPFLLEPLISLFGETGFNSWMFQQVLNGIYHPPMVCNPYVAKLLWHLQYPRNLQHIPAQSLHKYQSGWHKACEAMSSSPLGNHFGHYIVGTFNPARPIGLQC